MMNWDDPLHPSADRSRCPFQPPIRYWRATPASAGKKAPAQVDVAPVNPDDKRVINGMTDINQLAPFKYPWAWSIFNANRNH